MRVKLPEEGLKLCLRYAWPPNSLHLCGPDSGQNLLYYSTTEKCDNKTIEYLKSFEVLYPYLCFIAGENKIKNEFNERVVRAYWTGNSLLKNIESPKYSRFLDGPLDFKNKLPAKQRNKIMDNITSKKHSLPCHSFHVMALYLKNRNLVTNSLVKMIDACIIKQGKIFSLNGGVIMLETIRLSFHNDKLYFSQKKICHKILLRPHDDRLILNLKRGDFVTFHWGYFCEKITGNQAGILDYYNNLALNYANECLI